MTFVRQNPPLVRRKRLSHEPVGTSIASVVARRVIETAVDTPVGATVALGTLKSVPCRPPYASGCRSPTGMRRSLEAPTELEGDREPTRQEQPTPSILTAAPTHWSRCTRSAASLARRRSRGRVRGHQQDSRLGIPLARPALRGKGLAGTFPLVLREISHMRVAPPASQSCGPASAWCGADQVPDCERAPPASVGRHRSLHSPGLPGRAGGTLRRSCASRAHDRHRGNLNAHERGFDANPSPADRP